MRCILISDHEIPARPPMKVYPGEELEVGERDTGWPAFAFVMGEKGTGWVPARHLRIRGTRGTVLVDYDTAELPAAKGESVDVLADDQESGWSWCRNADGREGWVPSRALRPL